MGTEPQTLAGATELSAPPAPRAFLVITIDDGGSRLVDLPEGVDVTFGRSRGATITLDSEKVSRMHARVRRTGDVIEVEDLGSRNGTRVNGDKIEGPRKLATGDEVLDQVERAIRPMDLIAEDAGDDYLVILPELNRDDGAAAVQRLLDFARAANVQSSAAIALCPDDGTTVEALIGVLRAGLRTGHVPRAPSVKGTPIVLDPAMQRVYTLVQRIADTSMTVLILGETGVGKELVCEAIHQQSSRRDRPLIKLNCAALPETLLESELFGYERGAFTGADKRKVGFFEAADGGTLFLDEIGDMPLALQAKLLRVLERKVITRVGGTAEVATDARLIAATHRDLDADVRAGRFRQDLLFRIGGFTVVVPPLRDRAAEIVPLAEHFARTAAAEQARVPPTLSADAREVLSGYAWPGNVRELRNALERALVLATDTITATDLPER